MDHSFFSQNPTQKRAVGAALLLLVAFFVERCTSHVQPIKFGKDKCDFCNSIIIEPAFAAEIVLKWNKTYKFDDLSCMLGHLEKEPLKDPDQTRIRVANYADPTGNWLDVREAVFVKSDTYKSPKGGNTAAFVNGAAANAKLPTGAMIYKWEELPRK